MKRPFHSVLPCAVAALAFSMLTACSGGSGSDPATGPQLLPPQALQKGIEGGGIVSRFGASFATVTIGDVVYDTTDSALAVTIDRQPVSLSDLEVGNVVQIRATTDDNGVTAVATSIDQINDLEGPVAAGSIDLDAQTFVILGQLVRIVATTVFASDIAPGSLAGLADGDGLEVSVLRDGSGAFVATRVARDDDAGDFEITGAVSDLDGAALVFNLGALTVDYSGATLVDFDGAQIVSGDVVEVEGDALDGNGNLIALTVARQSPSFSGESGDFGEIEGFVTRFVSSTDFDVDGLPVTTNAQTVYEDGNVTNLVLSARVEVDGVLNEGGVLVASKIDFEDFEDGAEIELAALVDAVDPGASTLTVLGLSISVVPSTELEDETEATMNSFSLDDLAIGDFVEIKAFAAPSLPETLVAVQLKRDEDEEGEAVLQGPVDALMQPQLTVVGIAVAALPSTQYELSNNTVVSAADFFDAVTVGDVVEAKGTWDGATLTAREIELED